ncbi:MAG: VTT domain-containing protein [Acidobacteriota bacterium]|nr:VTT domain-containing protein [Acidobacteriota bacterium]
MIIKDLRNKIYSYFKEFGRLTPIALVTTFMPVVGSSLLLAFAYPLGYWLRENWEIGAGLYVFGILFFCGLALLPTNVIGIVGGWAFGFYLGIALLISGIVGAACASFLIHSRIVGDQLPKVFDAHPKAKVIYHALLGQSVWRTTLIIFLLRLSPAMPFALTNFLMASARVSLKSYLIGTFFGMLPRSSAVVFVGAGLSELNFENAESSWLIIGGIIATITSVIVIGLISKRALEHLTLEKTA